MLKDFISVGEGAFKRLCEEVADYDKVSTTVFGVVTRMEFFTKDDNLFGLIFITEGEEERFIKESFITI